MTKTKMPLVELPEKQDDGDLLRAVAEAVLQLIMETDGCQITTWKAGSAPGAMNAPMDALPAGTATATGRWMPGWGH